MEKWNEMSTKVKIGTVVGIIVGIAIIIGLYAISMNSHQDTTTGSESSSSVSSVSSSSSEDTGTLYKEGRDYTIKRSHKDLINDDKLQKAIDHAGYEFKDFNSNIVDTMQFVVSVTLYYDSENDRVIEYYVDSDGYAPIAAYDYKTNKFINDNTVGSYPDSVKNLPIVWSFKNNLLKTNK